MQDFTPLPNWTDLSAAELIERVEQAGISGMGGGGFSTARKLRLARQAGVLRVIANAVECEPGITVDATLLAEHSTAVAQGLRLVMSAVGATQGVLAFAADFPKTTIAGITQAFDHTRMTDKPAPNDPAITCSAIQRTPGAGAERSLCQRLFELALKPTQYPIDAGVLCLNVGTLFAIQQAVLFGQPLQQRLVTVNGNTRWVALGQTLGEVLPQPDDQGTTPNYRYRIGGHYTGKFSTAQAQITPATNALWLVEAMPATPCTYCSRCSDACPEGLAPQTLLRLCQDTDRSEAFATDPQSTGQSALDSHGLWRCTDCGLCNNQCPSNINLLDHFQQAKAEAIAQQNTAAAAARAKQRHERHLVRVQARAKVALDRRASRRESRRQRQGGPDAWR